MTLTPGTRLGPYEILAPLGAGGMGEVYRARDTRLGRDVAIKVLPQHLSTNVEVRARFEREAKTVSSLNHPHICTLFDVGREGETDYLVMELVEGETLAHRLAKGALSATDVLKWGAQLADALDRAHRAGVVHRDLKPANVMLTKSGAKLMDFGLARAAGLSGGGAESAVTMASLSHSPTVAQPLTSEGTIVGTFQYMAPEQLEGKEADARSDIWAMGCVLYEMATGRRAFEGRSQASLISAIMSSEPAPVSQVAPLAPPGLDRLVRICLHKDPDERVQTAHDVKLQLLGIAEGASASSVSAPLPERRVSSARIPWAIATVSTLLAIGLAVLLASRGGTPNRPVQLKLTPPEHAAFVGYSSFSAISPDGRAAAFCAGDSSGGLGVWLQWFDSPEAIRLAPTLGIAEVFWSPDSRTIGFMDLRARKLSTLPVSGGTPAVLCDTPSGRGAAWSPRRVIVYAPVAQGPLFRVSANGGESLQATWLDSTRHEAAHRFPCFLPDGEHFLFASLPQGPDGFDIYVGSLDSREVRRIMTAGSAPTYAEPGYLLFRRGTKLMAQRFDARRLELDGDAVPLADLHEPGDIDAEPVATASKDGRLVFLSNPPPERKLGWLDRTGTLRGTLPLLAGDWGRPVLSPDDRYAVVPNGDDLWRVDLTRAVAVRLTSNGALNSIPVWSPDGTQIAFTVGRQGREEIFVMNSDGSGEAKLLPTTTDLFKSPEDWTREGLIFNNIGSETFRDLWIAPTTGDGRPAPLIQTRFAEHTAQVSPDGSWIAYLSTEAGAEDVYIQSYPVPGRKVRVSTRGANRVAWMPDGNEVCYGSADGDMISVSLTRRGNDLDVGEPRTLFRFPPGVEEADMAHDGQRFLVSYSTPGAQRGVLRVVLNWTELLSK